MLKIFLIRHGKTYGNTLKRYVGTTDEPLLPESVEQLKHGKYPSVQSVYSSPLQRALQTASTIFPNIKPIIVDDLKECDFGEFENKNYLELADSESYKKWIKSNGTLPFPNGEETESFKKRCVLAFCNIAQENKNKDISIAIITHGGTIMSILEDLSTEKQSFYKWTIENGEGYQCEVNGNNTINVIRKI